MRLKLVTFQQTAMASTETLFVICLLYYSSISVW